MGPKLNKRPGRFIEYGNLIQFNSSCFVCVKNLYQSSLKRKTKAVPFNVYLCMFGETLTASENRNKF